MKRRSNAREVVQLMEELREAREHQTAASNVLHGTHTELYEGESDMPAYLACHSTSNHRLPGTLQMVFVIALLSCLVVSGPNAVVSIAGAATTAPRAAAKDAHKTVSLPHVYLMRGLMNVFSAWISWR